MYLRIIIFTCLVSLCVEVTQCDRLPQVLTLAERLKIFGTNSTFSLPDIEYASIRELNTSDLKPFRKRPANVIQYEMTLDNETFILTLRPNKYLTSPGCLVKHFSNDSKTPSIYPCEKDRINCFYTGSSDAHNESWVAANVCGGLRGVIRTGNTSLFIHPLNGLNDDSQPGVSRDSFHVVYRYQSEKQVCRFDETLGEVLHVVQPRFPGRKKRDMSSTQYIETSLIVDPSMVRFHGDDLQSYVMMVTNVASKLFRDPSIGSDVQLVVTEIIILDINVGFSISTDAGRTLKSFCQWKQGMDDASDNKTTPDISVLLTRLDIEYQGHFDTTGLANTGKACYDYKKCAIVEDNGPTMGITLAHEIGHLLGMRHDNSSHENTCSPRIMSEMGHSGSEAFSWSRCSASELSNSIRNGNLQCLENIPVGLEYIHKEVGYDVPLPGMIYDADSQCTMFLRKDTSHCPHVASDPCANIVCLEERSNTEECYLYSLPLMDGTDCNNTRTWCMRGNCVAMNDTFNTSPVDGAWSEWDAEYTACSATCGGGIKTKRRRCNNPLPQYGGRACVGENVIAEICNLEKCNTVGFKTLQCMEKGNASDGAWVPLHDKYGDEGCRMSCISAMYNVLSDTYFYKDGTECQFFDLDNPFSRCVHRRCRRFGCDGKMDSVLRYDKCGECAGNGTTCRQVSKTITDPIKYNINRYRAVVTIPKGSTGIYIRQNHSSVFLEVRNSTSTIISDPFLYTSTVFEEGGIRILYELNPETIHINGPIPDSLLILTSIKPRVISPHLDELFSVNYAYHVPLSATPTSRYYWALTVQPCTVSCGGGVQHRTVQCWSTYGPADNYLCDINSKPTEQDENCNSHPCPPRWHPSDWGPCSVTCEEGIKSRSFTCLQFDNGVDKVIDKSNCRFGHAPSNITCNNGVCPRIWRQVAESTCSTTCGKGLLTRTYQCFADDNTMMVLDDNYCNPTDKPASQSECNKGPCIRSLECADEGCSEVYASDICYGNYAPWAKAHCSATCGFCSDQDDPMCQTYINWNAVAEMCHTYSDWTHDHCPNMCKHCTGCVDNPQPGYACAAIDRKYCTDPKYKLYMTKHCPQHCCVCHTVG